MSGAILRRATAAELRAAFQSGAATSRAVTDELFTAIEREDGVLGAWLHLRQEDARAEADRADARYATALPRAPQRLTNSRHSSASLLR